MDKNIIAQFTQIYIEKLFHNIVIPLFIRIVFIRTRSCFVKLYQNISERKKNTYALSVFVVNCNQKPFENSKLRVYITRY